MRRAKTQMIHNPFLEEFVYDIIYSLTPMQRRSLPNEYVKVTKTPKAAKTFARMASLEQKYHLLSCLGIKWCNVFFNEEMTPHSFKEIMRKYKDDKPMAGLKEMAAEKLYITSDREFMHLLVAMAQSIHNPQYQLSLEWNKLGYRLNQWGTWTKSAENPDFTTALENLEAVNKFSLLLEHHDRTCETMSDVFSIRHVDFRILNFFFRNKSQYVEKEAAFIYFSNQFTKTLINSCINRLTVGQFLQKSAIPDAKQYTITGLGIDLTQKIFMRTLKSTNF